MLASMPPRVRELYGLRYTRARARDRSSGVHPRRAHSHSRPLTRGSSRRSYEMVARTERWRIENAKPTPQVRT